MKKKHGIETISTKNAREKALEHQGDDSKSIKQQYLNGKELFHPEF